jgi:nucleoside-diphosphate-sugar epimerase
MHLILTGATGLIGTGVLDRMLKTTDVTKISILARRPVPFADDVKDPRVNVIIHNDFMNYDAPSLQEQLKGAKGCVWALGTTSTTQVTEGEYRQVTRDFTVEAAKAFAKMGSEAEPFRFVYITGEGATQTPGMFTTLYGKVKGETEAMLTEVAKDQPGIMVLAARVGGVDGTGHAEVKKYGPQRIFMHRAFEATMMGPMKLFYSKMHTPTAKLGDACTKLVSFPYRLLLQENFVTDRIW